jgi:hypothetical protein
MRKIETRKQGSKPITQKPGTQDCPGIFTEDKITSGHS